VTVVSTVIYVVGDQTTAPYGTRSTADF